MYGYRSFEATKEEEPPMRVYGVSTVAGSSCTLMPLAVVLVVTDVELEPSNTNCIGSSSSSASSSMTADMGTILSESSDDCPLVFPLEWSAPSRRDSLRLVRFVDCCRGEDTSMASCIGSTSERGRAS